MHKQTKKIVVLVLLMLVIWAQTALAERIKSFQDFKMRLHELSDAKAKTSETYAQALCHKVYLALQNLYLISGKLPDNPKVITKTLDYPISFNKFFPKRGYYCQYKKINNAQYEFYAYPSSKNQRIFFVNQSGEIRIGNSQGKLLIDEIIEQYSELLNKNPKDIKTYFERGVAYKEKGEDDLAMSDFNYAAKKLTAIPKKKNEDINLLARIYAEQASMMFENKKPTEALERISQAIKLDASNPYFYWTRGEIYLFQNKNTLSLEDIDRSLQLIGDDNDTKEQLLLQKTLLLGKKGDFDGSIKTANQCIDMNQDNPWAYYYKGLAYAEKGQPVQSMNAFNRAITINPYCGLFYQFRAYAFFDNKEYEKAICDAEKAMELGIKDIDPQFIKDARQHSMKNKK